jgi:methyltransferase (TIGR00027 family)
LTDQLAPPELALSAGGTAQAVAGMRAFHQIGDGEPKILSDPIAIRLLDPRARHALMAAPERLQTAAMRGLRTHVLLRSRYAEDELKRAVDAGVDQYVILGAGFDTFAWRQPAWAVGLRIFEVDRPSAQATKRARVAQAGLEVPANLRFVPVDFEQDNLLTALAASGFASDRPAFCALLGVMVYLTAGAADALLLAVSSMRTGTRLVMTFSPPVDDPDAGDRSAAHAELAASIGEPWRMRISAADLERQLRELGFNRLSFLSVEEATRRYFTGRTDGLPPPRRVRILHATRS